MGGLSGDHFPRISLECLIHSTPSNLEPTGEVTNLLTPDYDLPSMSLFGKIWGEIVGCGGI